MEGEGGEGRDTRKNPGYGPVISQYSVFSKADGQCKTRPMSHLKQSQQFLPFVFRRAVSSPAFLSSSSHNWLQTHIDISSLVHPTRQKLTRQQYLIGRDAKGPVWH